MKFDLKEFQTLVFDCDGVILNSNKVKTEAFYQTALPFGEKAAHDLVNYHVARGGVSRYKKFRWFIESVLKDKYKADLKTLVDSYAQCVIEGLMNCDVVSNLEKIRKHTESSNWLIVSGGDQAELREVFEIRKLSKYFDGGIFGSPDSKDKILSREKASGNIKPRAIFFGDSKYDYEASKNAGLDFIFLNYWTEFKGWESFCEEQKIEVRSSIDEML